MAESEEDPTEGQSTLNPQPNNLEQLVEAALFMSSRAMSLHDLMKVTGADSPSIRDAVKRLQESYSQRGSWIEVVRVDKSYLMRLKPDRTDSVSSFIQETELSKRALRVLAVVAQHDGVLQSRVVKMLGPIVYEAVPELTQKGYLHTEIKGHSKVLRLTQKFRNYFGEIPIGEKPAAETGQAAPESDPRASPGDPSA